MDHIVKKLSEIEHAAEAVVEHAELEKSELEERIQNERNQFDKQLEDHTQKELNDIHKGLNRQMDEILACFLQCIANLHNEQYLHHYKLEARNL